MPTQERSLAGARTFWAFLRGRAAENPVEEQKQLWQRAISCDQSGDTGEPQ